MKIAVGYQEPENRELFSRIVDDYRDHICEVYFALPGSPSGRADYARSNSIDRLEDELTAIRQMGIKLDLLFNANCYGEKAQARSFFSEVGETVDYVARNFYLSSVTTTSPLTILPA